MGTTCTSLHVLRTGAQPFLADLSKAYEKIGFVAAEDAGDGAHKRVLVSDDGQSKFLSIHDSDNALIDSGELKELAVALSKRLKSVAVLTSVYDSDRFEFIVFHKGKQVDAVVSPADDHSGRLKSLSQKRRTATWSDLFLGPDLLRSLATHPPVLLDPARLAALAERHHDFKQRLADAAQKVGAFAEDLLGAWCEIAGLEVSQALAGFEEVLRHDEPAPTALVLRKTAATETETPAAGAAPGEPVKLVVYHSDDDCPYLRYYPAAWPIPVGETQRVKWLVLSQGAGFSGLSLELEIDGPTALSIGKISVHAYPFYNGQITSPTPLATWMTTPPRDPQDGALRFAIEPLEIAGVDREARKQIHFAGGPRARRERRPRLHPASQACGARAGHRGPSPAPPETAPVPTQFCRQSPSPIRPATSRPFSAATNRRCCRCWPFSMTMVRSSAAASGTCAKPFSPGLPRPREPSSWLRRKSI